MSEERLSEEYVIEIVCPFCGALLARDYDLSAIDEDLLDELPVPIWEFKCPHIAAHAVIGYVEEEVSEPWHQEFEQICKWVDPEMEPNLDELLNRLGEGEGINMRRLKRKWPDLNIAYFDRYIEKFDGIQQGGPTLKVLLLNRVPNQTKES